jgi:hypothetical protein
MRRINYICDGREYTATFEGDEVASIYDWREARYLNEDRESNVRERSHVWVTAYTMAED